MWVEDVKTAVASSYALLTAFQSATSFNSARARLVFANGTEQTVDASKSSDSLPTLDDRTDEPILVRYAENSDGSYTLKRLTETEFVKSSAAAIRNRTAYGLNGTADSTAIPADDNTIFVVADSNGSGFKTYTGIRTVPNVDGASVRAYTYVQGGVAKVVYIVNGTTSTTSRELMFIAAASASNVITDSSSTAGYRTFNTITNGRNEVIKVQVGSTIGGLTVGGDSSFQPKGGDSVLVNSANFNANGIYISGSFTGTSVTANRAQGFTAPSGGFMSVGTRAEDGSAQSGTRLALAEGVEIYSVSDKGVITETTASRLTASDDDFVYYTVVDGEIDTLFVVKN